MYLIELVELDVVVLLEHELEEPSFDKVLPRVIVAHLHGLELVTPVAGVAVLRKLHLG